MQWNAVWRVRGLEEVEGSGHVDLDEVEAACAGVVHQVRPHLRRAARVVDRARLQKHVLAIDGYGATVEGHI